MELTKSFPRPEIPFVGYIFATISILFLSISLLLVWFIFGKSPDLISAPQITGYCLTPDLKQQVGCNIKLTSLQDGRYRLALDDFSNKIVQLKISFPQNTFPQTILIRNGMNFFNLPLANSIKATLSQQNNSANKIEINLSQPTSRIITVIPQPLQTDNFILTLENTKPTQTNKTQLVLDEIGFTQVKHPFLTHSLIDIQKYFYSYLINFILSVAFIACICGFLLPKSKNIVAMIYVFSLLCIVYFTGIWFLHDPNYNLDLRTTFLSGALQEGTGSNLNYAIYMTSALLQKNIFSPIFIEWCRMPGYSLWLATFTWLVGNPNNLLKIALYGIFWQISLIAAALSYFYWSASKIMRKELVLTICTLLVLLPSMSGQIQIEAFIPAIVFFCLGNSCLYLDQLKQQPIPALKYHLLLHSGFAVWFLTRPDITPAWFLVSFFLYIGSKQTLKYLLIPLLGFLILGISWALIKYPVIHEFSMTTNSVGASSMVGLWEIPNKFLYTEPSDNTYANWIQSFHMLFISKAASSYTMHQVIRFYFTYPGYVISLVWHKFIQYILLPGYHFPGNLAIFNLINIGVSTTAFILSSFLALTVTGLVIGYQRKTLLLLGWPLFFNLPVFFLVYSSMGRFAMPGTISLLILGFYLLFNMEFWRLLSKRFFLSIIIFLVVGTIPLWGLAFDNFLIHWDAFRYATPFLDPAKIQFQGLSS